MKAKKSPQQFVAYYRVSTNKQGRSGLGLEAQKQSVQSYIASRNGKLVKEFQEVETGTSKRQRVAIYTAIEECKKAGAILIIAKLDRLARNVHFVSGLMESKVAFVCVDNPNVNPLTIHILSAIAEQETKLISERTKAALVIARQRGKQIGSPQNLTASAIKKATKARKQLARENTNNIKASGYIKSLRKQGLTFAAIAETLNYEGFLTARNKNFKPMTVYKLHERV